MWSKYKIEDEQIYTAKVGYTRFWIQRYLTFWRVSVKNESSADFHPEGLEKVNSVPSGFTWQQMIAGKANTLIMQPALPDKPVIIKPENNISLLPSMKLEIFVNIPLWIQFYASSVKPEHLIYEFPSVILSPTWFGDTDDGELAYRLPEHIQFDYSNNNKEEFEAVCPVKIHNESDELISFQRISIHTDQLTMYGDGKLFVTNEIRVNHKNNETESDVDIIMGSPSFIQGLKPVSAARMKPNKSLLRKSFHMIKSITNS